MYFHYFPNGDLRAIVEYQIQKTDIDAVPAVLEFATFACPHMCS